MNFEMLVILIGEELVKRFEESNLMDYWCTYLYWLKVDCYSINQLLPMLRLSHWS